MSEQPIDRYVTPASQYITIESGQTASVQFSNVLKKFRVMAYKTDADTAELMLTVPPKYTAYQGFDALFHNTEVMISNGINIMSETLALSAIENIAKYLPIAVRDGKNLEARERVAYGSTVAGMTMQLTSTTAEHSMEHSMSAYHHDLPHGAGLIMISRAFYEFFIEKHACDGQFIKMAKAMGIEDADKPQAPTPVMRTVFLLQYQKASG